MPNKHNSAAKVWTHKSHLSPPESSEILRRKAGIKSFWNVSSGDVTEKPEANVIVNNGNFTSKGLWE